MTERVRGFTGSIWSRWVPSGSGPEPSDLCLTQYLVSPSALLAPYQTIQAAYAAAKAAGHGPANPAQVLVCPGTYSGLLTLDRAGIDILAVAANPQVAQGTGNAGAAGRGTTVFTGNLIIDPVSGGSIDTTSIRWVGIDIRAAAGDAIVFGGVNNAAAYIYIEDCVVTSLTTGVLVTNTGVDGFNASVLDIQRCSVEPADPAALGIVVVGVAFPFPNVVGSQCRIIGVDAFRADHGFSAFESCVLLGEDNAVSLVSGATETHDCYLGGFAVATIDEDSFFVVHDSTFNPSPFGPCVVGTGQFNHDAIMFTRGVTPWDPNLSVATLPGVPFESNVAQINASFGYPLTSETNVAAYSPVPGVGTLILPPGGSRPGVLRLKLGSLDVGGVNVVGNGADVIRLGGAVPAASVPLTADGIFLVWNPAGGISGWWEGWVAGGGGGGVNCLGHYLVAPSAVYAPYQSIQLAYNQAKADGHDAANPAKVLVCPGIYVEDVTMDTSGIDIIGVAKDPFNEWRGYFAQGTTILQGNLTINLTLGAQPGQNPRSAAWRGIDIQAPVEAVSAPAIYFTGTGFQRAYISDCRLTQNATYVITGDNSGIGGPGAGESTLDLVECGIINSVGPNGGAPPVVNWDDGRLELSDCVIFGRTLDDSFDQEAGSTVVATDCRIWGDWDTAGSAFLRQCEYMGTFNLSDSDAVVEVLNSELDTIIGGGVLVTGIGTFKYDQIPWSQGTLGTIAATVTQQQYESTPPGSFYKIVAVAAYQITTESNIVVMLAGALLTLPPAPSRQGPIRLKDRSVVGGANIQGSGGDTINGAAGPLAIPITGITLIPDGISNWESFA